MCLVCLELMYFWGVALSKKSQKLLLGEVKTGCGRWLFRALDRRKQRLVIPSPSMKSTFHLLQPFHRCSPERVMWCLLHLYWICNWIQVCCSSLSCVVAKLCDSLSIPWTVAHQAPQSMGFPRHKYWSGFHFFLQGNLPDSGIEPTSSCIAGRFFTVEPPEKPSENLYINF